MNEKDYVNMLCIECKKIYTIKPGMSYAIGFVFIITSIVMFFTRLFEDGQVERPSTITFIILITIFLIGVYLLNSHRRERQDCPICNSYKTLIKIDTSEAIELIKKYDISFSDEVINTDISNIKKYPWEK